MNSTKAFILLFVSLLTVSAWGDLQNEVPYMGRVTGNRVNVRAGAADSVVLTQLQKGDFVHVLEEQDGWCRILPPKGTMFWIFSRLLDKGWPKSDDINVRSGPGIHYPSVCKVGKNSSIDVVSRKGAWTQILPPKNSSAWISKDYVRYFSSPEDYFAKIEDEKRSLELFQQAETFRSDKLRQDVNEATFDEILAKYISIQNFYPDFPVIEKVQARIRDLQAKKDVFQSQLEASHMRKKRAAVKIPVKTTISPEPTVRIENKKVEPVLLSFEGKLRPLKMDPQSLFTHQLLGGFLNSRRRCLLSAPDIDLASYHNKKVRVWGQFVAAESAGISGIRVERIELAR